MSEKSAIEGQLNRIHEWLRDTIDKFPETEWRSGPDEYRVPVRLAYHAVETIDFYASESPDGFNWGARFGASWEGDDIDLMPAQDQLLEYLDDVEGKLAAQLGTVNAAGWPDENPFPWTGSSILEHFIYVIRHTQFHIAELNLELHIRGLPTSEWR